MLNFIKEKSYYFLGGTVLILVILIVIASCSSSGGSSYEEMEGKLVVAAKKYYSKFSDRLPNEEGNKVSVDINSLVESELIEPIKDPKNSSSYCSGYVDVTKTGDDYYYVPILKCLEYETAFLSDVIKNSERDEYGNGVYEENGEYIYKGEEVNNYIMFSNMLWRIIKVDGEGKLKLLYSHEKKLPSAKWDTDYNSEIKKPYGDTTDYLQADIRKTLVSFYDTFILEESRKYMVNKDICVGGKYEEEDTSLEKECMIIKEKEKVGLLQVSDYKTASLDDGCVRFDSPECANRNYLASSKAKSWLLTRTLDNTYEVYYLNGGIKVRRANQSNAINPVIYLNSGTLLKSGDGTKTNPYTIR